MADPLDLTAKTAAADVVAFQRRVRAAILDVAVDVNGEDHGTTGYTTVQHEARAVLAQKVCEDPSWWAETFAAVIAANIWQPAGGLPHVVPGDGTSSDPLPSTAPTDPPADPRQEHHDAALRAGVEYSWDTVAGMISTPN